MLMAPLTNTKADQLPKVFNKPLPVVKSTTIRIIFSLAVTHGWEIQQVDDNNAFLNGEHDEIVLMAQPAGFEDLLRPHFV